MGEGGHGGGGHGGGRRHENVTYRPKTVRSPQKGLDLGLIFLR